MLPRDVWMSDLYNGLTGPLLCPLLAAENVSVRFMVPNRTCLQQLTNIDVFTAYIHVCPDLREI